MRMTLSCPSRWLQLMPASLKRFQSFHSDCVCQAKQCQKWNCSSQGRNWGWFSCSNSECFLPVTEKVHHQCGKISRSLRWTLKSLSLCSPRQLWKKKSSRSLTQSPSPRPSRCVHTCCKGHIQVAMQTQSINVTFLTSGTNGLIEPSLKDFNIQLHCQKWNNVNVWVKICYECRIFVLFSSSPLTSIFVIHN